MFSIVRPSSLFATKPMLTRANSALNPGQILQGNRWNYRILKAVKGDSTHTSTIFKAEVLPHRNTTESPPKWAVIKVPSPDNADAQGNLSREHNMYRLDCVNSAACFRRLYELIKKFLKAALRSCVILDGQKLVNTDYKPGNILVSGINTGSVKAKVGDLGLVFPSGGRINAQPLAMRAPEIFLGHACSPSPYIDNAWSMAKIKRLFPGWNIPHPDEVERSTLKLAVEYAAEFADGSEGAEDLQAILMFEEETRKVEMPQQLRDLLRLMLECDPNKRPSALCVLKSKQFWAFENLSA
ncbi:hypothetical protein LOZ12_000638 [Ophidiomyces ophidiicola]|uniref:Uncharacterized protein n=1 Tax=Ophidiomyces ophidiicola TaxID=1387563 RepID=A0ACB8V110_9EURO|nr:uncharacterized protein LOZ57_000081 [Ophidiomyces ophidiicola]KAI1922195.1 hypothetical protein LOZ64_001308 [Ophidiomyces ophidiicola]KAI1953740.1 hypothetical protein LOZ57_000081 [Ophidiomyces ophidiicola]KAI1954850.1 hypothetical protein LOZ62_000627 [Ophidiomyces ophidiicola]KAI2011037.1 hypothetical protein LOZ50_000832 [Ophidiomyces ophidiicola]KAI2031318.1 hypothetical protein LOZ45_001381 [Ophidiomyces ophidiicola]